MAEEPENQSFREAVLDMGQLFKDMKTQKGISHGVTLDIVRIQLMYMQQQPAAPVAVDEPVPEDIDVNEVIEAEYEPTEGPALTVVPDDE